MSEGASLRRSGPVGAAPTSGSGEMSQSKAVTANTVAHECAAGKAQTNVKTKDTSSYSCPGELGAKGMGGAS